MAGWAVYKFHPPQTHRANHAPAYRAPAEHRYALEGTFYMVRYAAASDTPKGTYGFEPGREVHLAQVECADRAHRGGQRRAAIHRDQTRLLLTRDLDVADAVRRADQAAQARHRQRPRTTTRCLRDSHTGPFTSPMRGMPTRRNSNACAARPSASSYNPLRANPRSRWTTRFPPRSPTPPRPAAADLTPSDLDPALSSFLNQPAFGRLPSASGIAAASTRRTGLRSSRVWHYPWRMTESAQL